MNLLTPTYKIPTKYIHTSNLSTKRLFKGQTAGTSRVDNNRKDLRRFEKSGEVDILSRKLNFREIKEQIST